ncbi:MAG: DUF1552 domain-containing protein, partial [Proteobacteria bacterium]
MIPRRKFLLGAGGIVFGLPFLESISGLAPYARADEILETEPQKYAIFFRSAHGFVRKNLWPSQKGAITEATLKGKSIEVLTPYAKNLLIVEGISHPFGSDGCDHKYGGIQSLTGAKPYRGANEGVNLALATSESLDFRIQRDLMPGVEPLILTSGKRNTDRLGIQDFLSFRGSKDLVSAEISPFNAYKKVFGMSSTGPSDARLLLRKSVNDYVKEGMSALLASSKLSASDKDRLQLHMDGIRDTEKKIAIHLSDERISQMEKGSNVSEYENNTIEVLKMQLDVIAIAIAAGSFRAVTIQIGAGIDATQYLIKGQRFAGAHAISHRVATQMPFMDGAPLAGAEEMHIQLDIMHAELFKYLLDRLSSYKFGNQTLLDFGTVMWFSEIADGPSHSHDNIPHILAGSAGNSLKVGNYVAGNSHVNKILNTVGTAVGVKNAQGGPLDNFGDKDLVAANKDG